MLGLIKFRNALVRLGLPADTYNKILFDWANHYNWKICTEDGNKTPHNPDNQLCGSTYIELFLLDGQTNKTWIEDTVKVIDSEASGSFPQKWTWVDTLFMSMNTWSRVYQVLKLDTYSTTQAALFDTTRVGEHFWNITEQLWYRDARYLKTDVFWGRGNGWAIGSLVDTIRLANTKQPSYAIYVQNFKELATKLKGLQGSDGCWRSSLLDPINYPTPEVTGTSLITYGLAFGINSNIIDKTEFMNSVEMGWNCISKFALQPSGLLGYCEPIGYEPQHGITPTSTSDFCVGQFLLASTEVAVLAGK